MSPHVGVESSTGLLQRLSYTEAENQSKKKARGVSHKDWMDLKHFEFWDLRSQSRGDSPRLCDFTHLSCTVQFGKENPPLLTNYLYVWTLAVGLFQYKRKKMFWWFWRHERGLCSQVQFSVTLTISKSFFFSPRYSCHPCFLLYYSIFEWCQVLYMVWTYVCEEKIVRVSTGRCFIFVMKYIKLTYIQAGIMFVSYVVVVCLYLIQWRRCRNGTWGGVESGRKAASEAQAQTWQPHSLWLCQPWERQNHLGHSSDK